MQLNNPLVSVIICTFNQEETISQTIECILTQKCNFNFEIIIGEDCGQDKTREICIEYQKKFPELIILNLIPQNKGVVNNWLSCVRIATGKYITTCAGDDFWHNIDKLQLQVDYMEKNPTCGILHTDFNELNTVTKKQINSYNKHFNIEIKTGNVQKLIFSGELKICAPTICYRKKLLDQHIPFEKYLELGFPIEDWPTNIIVSNYSSVDYIAESTVTYRKGHESISNPKSYDKILNRFKYEKQMYKFLCEMFPENLIYDEKGYDIYILSVLLSLAVKRNDVKKANEFATQMLTLGANSVRTRMLANWVGFKVFRLLKTIKQLN